MAIAAFTTVEKTNHRSHKFGFTLSHTNYGYWKTMIQPFLITNGLLAISTDLFLVHLKPLQLHQPLNQILILLHGSPMMLMSLWLSLERLREEYNSLKSTLIARQPPVAFLELSGLLADHEYMIKKIDSTILTAQVFTTTSNYNSASSSLTPETIQSLQKLMTQLGFNVQPAQQPNHPT
uniref:Retrotransposon Copia-like N-terminal domain-containing protein n=1 Tax=Lactuca sativa TaxID=4236 RepID=A0A9R1X8A9_LACSA|nr:hypothetical protein LSAT_V11C500263470 [Lactuca sativa]